MNCEGLLANFERSGSNVEEVSECRRDFDDVDMARYSSCYDAAIAKLFEVVLKSRYATRAAI